MNTSAPSPNTAASAAPAGSSRHFVVVVVFEVAAAQAEPFLQLLLANARQSREEEPGCLQFDVCIDPQHDGVFYLYEVYRRRADFSAHLQTDHFRKFAALTDGWLLGKRVDQYERLVPSGSAAGL